MILFACAVMVVVGAGLMVIAIRAGRDNREAWRAFDLYYPATWEAGDCEGNWHITIVVPPDHSKPDVTIRLEDDVIRSWEELNA